MRTDSVRVADEALAEVREYIGQRVRRRVPAREAERLQDEGGRAGRARSDPADVDAVRPGNGPAHLTPDQYSLYRLIWNRFVASQMPPATFDETTVDITAARLSVPRQGHGAEVRRLDGGLRPATPGEPAGAEGRRRARRGTAEDDEESGVLPPLREGDRARAEGAPAGAEVHPAAAALLRSDARQGARGERHRPAEHLRVDHRRAAGSRIRQQDRGPVQADGARHDDRRQAAQTGFDDIIDVEYTRSLEEDLDKIEQGKANYAKTLDELLQEVQEGSRRARQGDDQLQEGDRDRRSRATSAARRC